MPLERIRRIARISDTPFKDGKVELDDGAKFDVVVLEHGTRNIIASRVGTHSALLVYVVNISEDEGRSINKMAENERRDFLAILRREMLDGRGGYNILYDTTQTPPVMRQIRIEQKVFLQTVDGATTQRVLDSMQELVSVGVRAELFIALTFQRLAGAEKKADTGTSPEGMYT